MRKQRNTGVNPWNPPLTLIFTVDVERQDMAMLMMRPSLKEQLCVMNATNGLILLVLKAFSILMRLLCVIIVCHTNRQLQITVSNFDDQIECERSLINFQIVFNWNHQHREIRVCSTSVTYVERSTDSLTELDRRCWYSMENTGIQLVSLSSTMGLMTIR